MTPTTELVLADKRPDDAAWVAATLEEIGQFKRSTDHPPSHHRRRGASPRCGGDGGGLQDRGGALIVTHGFYVDVTPSEEARDEEFSAVVADIAEHRAATEQTEAMLMLIYRIPADTEFELLKWRSQTTNVKLRAPAQQLSADFLTRPTPSSSTSR